MKMLVQVMSRFPFPIENHYSPISMIENERQYSEPKLEEKCSELELEEDSEEEDPDYILDVDNNVEYVEVDMTYFKACVDYDDKRS